MNYIRKADERGKVDLGWLQSNHSFSFGHYYDPKHMGVSVLRVINDDVVMPAEGFGTHGHRDMEIISYVLEGALEHHDSTGNTYVINAGEVQRMSAGSGITHSEYNASKTAKVNFLQIWIKPRINGIKPGYEQKKIEQGGALTTLVTPNGTGDSLTINQDMSLYRLKLSAGESYELAAGNRLGYFHIVSGYISVKENNFGNGDAFSVDSGESVLIEAKEDLEALWFDLPKVN